MDNLIDGCIKGKTKARQELFHQYRRMLLGICMRYARDKSEAEDILIEGFFQIYTKIGTFSNEGSFEGWMKRVVVNTAIDYFRKKKKGNFSSEYRRLQEPGFR
ncbi:MAG: RNA polymerase sigma factor [Bacteroidales bacterium]|jgi:RNA polymerase sigma-70 factor (ECF subfamily)